MKKVPTVGTRSFNLDLPGALVRSCSTATVYQSQMSHGPGKTSNTMVEDEPLDITHDLPIALMRVLGHGEQ